MSTPMTREQRAANYATASAAFIAASSAFEAASAAAVAAYISGDAARFDLEHQAEAAQWALHAATCRMVDCII